jgi:HD-like signal output (HDOD) protein/DNA-binding response OmpR family regulator
MPNNNILLVEPNLKTQTMYKIMLGNSFQCQITFSNNELEAIMTLETGAPDLIIIGSAVSIDSSADLIQFIRNSQDFRNIPIFKISTPISKRDLIEYVKLGTSDILLVNNFNLKNFIVRVKKLLEKTKGSVTTNNEIQKTLMAATKPDNKPANNTVIKKIQDQKQKQEKETEKPSKQATKSYPDTTRVDKTKEILDNLTELMPLSLVEKKLSRIATVTPLPYIISELISLASSINTNINDLTKLIETDYALTAKVLKLANSAFYRRANKRIHNLKDAINTVGYFGVKDIALAISTINNIGKPDEEGTLSTLKVWHHSLATGIIAKEIAHLSNHQKPETCFVMGILSNLGLAILHDNFNKEYEQIIETAVTYGLPLVEVEKKLINITHYEITSKILNLWGFPRETYTPLSFLNLGFDEIFALDSKQDVFKKDIALIKLSEAISGILFGGLLPTEEILDISGDILSKQYLKISRDKLIEEILDIKDIVNETMQILLLQVEPEVLMSCDAFQKYKNFREPKCIVLKRDETRLPVFEIILKELKYSVKYIKNPMFETDIIKNEKPDFVLIDIDENARKVYNANYFNHLNHQIDKDNNTCFCIISSPEIISDLEEGLSNLENFIFYKKPYLTSNIVSYLEKIQNYYYNVALSR